ncbi:hypothetical protein [Nocardia sp. NPDC051833]|uniref:hypothetical protein n=1 Tax=Nocardia sp. NPDC051833 TaxID=3155674 RepID=UPI003427561D
MSTTPSPVANASTARRSSPHAITEPITRIGDFGSDGAAVAADRADSAPRPDTSEVSR